MEPIISPWIVYIASVCIKINQVAFFALVLSVIAIVGIVVAVFSEMTLADIGSSLLNDIFRWLKRISYVAIIAGLLCILIPNEETVLAMLTAYYVTPDNIQIVQGNIVDFVKQISNAVNDVTK